MSIIKSNFMEWPSLSSYFDNEWFKDRFGARDWAPSLNVIDNEDNYTLEIAVPGFKKEDIQISVEDGNMTVQAESKTEKEEKEKNYVRKEFGSNSFSKTFSLPVNINEEKIEAMYEDGVLKIKMEKGDLAVPPKKSIEIK